MIGALLDALSAPGDYTRGLLAGRAGERLQPRELLAGLGLADPQDGSWVGAARDLGVGLLTDPITYAGLGAARLAGGAGKSLLGLRRGFSLAQGVDEAGSPASLLGGRYGVEKDVARDIARLLPEQAALGTEGVFLDGRKVAELLGRPSAGGAGAASEAGGLAAARHEAMHGLIDAAAQAGDSSALGPLGRLAAWGNGGASDTGLRAGFGRLVGEAAAHAAEGRGALSQALGAGRFLFGGPARGHYAELIGRASPFMGDLYATLPYAPWAVGGGAAAGLGLGLATR